MPIPNHIMDAHNKRVENLRRKMNGGGMSPLHGPSSSGIPPAPNGQRGGGLFPNYGPVLINKSGPPGPTAGTLS